MVAYICASCLAKAFFASDTLSASISSLRFGITISTGATSSSLKNNKMIFHKIKRYTYSESDSISGLISTSGSILTSFLIFVFSNSFLISSFNFSLFAFSFFFFFLRCFSSDFNRASFSSGSRILSFLMFELNKIWQTK